MEGLAIHREIEDRSWEGYDLVYLARVCHHQGHLAEALEHVSDALEVLVGTGDEATVGLAHLCLGDVLLALGRVEEARVELETALALFERLNRKLETAQTQVRLARVLVAAGDDPRAEAALQAALPQLVGQAEVASAQLALARIDARRGGVEGLRLVEGAEARVRGTAHRALLAEVLATRASLLAGPHPALARAALDEALALALQETHPDTAEALATAALALG